MNIYFHATKGRKDNAVNCDKKYYSGLVNSLQTVAYWSHLAHKCFYLKGVLENYGHHRKPLGYPLSRVPISFSSVDPIFSKRKNNPRLIPYFSYFYACEKSTFKTTVKIKSTHFFENLTKHFSFA